MTLVVGSFPCSDDTFGGGFPGGFYLCGFLIVLAMVEAVDTLIPHDLVAVGCSFVARRLNRLLLSLYRNGLGVFLKLLLSSKYSGLVVLAVF